MPPPLSDASAAALTELRRDSAAHQRAINSLWQLTGAVGEQRQSYLYAILDAARDERIYPALRRLAATEKIVSLYQGPTAQELADVAPYLICLGTSDNVFNWLWNEAWGEHWGIFVWSMVSMSTLRDHFRRITIVQTQEKQRLLFRFYDPRVLSIFLPTCDADQLKEMFSTNVSRFLLPSHDGSKLRSYHLNERQLVEAQFQLMV